MSRGALLTGAVGGIIGTVTAAFGIIWIFIVNAFRAEIQYYLDQLGIYLTTFSPAWGLYGYPYPPPIPFYPSWALFGVSSFILSIFLIATSILIGIGFYGTYKIGGGKMGVVGLVFSIIGISAGALLIIMGNLITGQEKLNIGMGDVVEAYSISVLTPYFLIICLGFAVLGLTFLIVGASSIAVREATNMPSASHAAGILSIIGAIVFILGSLGSFIIFSLPGPGNYIGNYVNSIVISIGGFGLIFVAFILWAWVFYSSRNL